MKKLIVVLSRSRTGSNFLMGLLNNHPKIKFKGEIFKKGFESTPKEVVENNFEDANSFDLIGFKIFYYHATEYGGCYSALEKLEKNFEIKYVHLVRNNVPRSVISAEIAKKTHEWHLKESQSKLPVDNKKVIIDPMVLEKQIKVTKNNWTKAKEFLASRDSIEIEYESLTSNTSYQMSEVFSWLKVPVLSVSSWAQKQNPEPISELVENYSEILPILVSHGYE